MPIFSRHASCRPEVEELEERVVPTLMGQQLFPSDNPWNQNIANAPVAANSAAVIANIGPSIHLHPDWGADDPANGDSPLYGIPFNIVHGNSTATVNVIIDNYPGESDIVPVPIPQDAVIEGDYQDGPNPNGGGYNAGQRGDSHLIVWDEDNNIAYELFGVTRPSDPTLFPNPDGVELPHTDGLWHAAQETVWNMNTNTFRSLGETSADAAGLSILAGLVRPDEGLPVADGGQGVITHALRVTLPGSDVNPQYIYPASHQVDESQAADKLPFGARLRLANTPAIDTLIADMPPESQIIARAMQQYGLIVADIGSPMFVTGASATIDNVDSPSTDLTWDINDIFASNGLRVLTAGDFQVVDLTPRVTGLSKTSDTPGSTITITGQNFSGAAGNLSVYFGSTAAPSVTVLSDTQITAVVPAGSGTVNVLVQSGIDETDTFSDNPNANVTAPIFGYGKSAISTAGRFTLLPAGPNAAKSTAHFGTATDASGAADVLTIAVADAAGNAVSGLSATAFGFHLAGGTSTGTFGSVTETATPGTYTVPFTGATAGSASTLTITVNGIILTSRPTIRVTPGEVSAANSTLSFATPSVVAGHIDTLTIVARDAAGNAISGLAGTAFALDPASGGSAGKFGSVTATAPTGTYTASFTGITAGAASPITATVGGIVLSAAPTVTVTPGAVSGAVSTASFATSPVVSGSTGTLTISVKDSWGNAIGGLPAKAFTLLVGGVSTGSFDTVTETSTPGTYTATFTGTRAGSASTLTIYANGISLTARPSIQVAAGPVSAVTSTVHFAAPSIASGQKETVTIVLKDAAGNAITGLAASAFALNLVNGSSGGAFGAVTATTTPGTYTATFSALAAGSASALTTSVNGTNLSSQPTVTVTPGPVNAANSTASFATATVNVGQTDTLTLVIEDAAGNPISGLASSLFAFGLSGGTSAGRFGSVSATDPGTYAVVFTGITAGTASTVTVTVKGVPLGSKPIITV